MMKKIKVAACFLAPLTCFAQASLPLSLMQAVNSILGFLRPAMPYISSFLGFFASFLIPLGEFFGTLLQGPLNALSEAIPARSVTGYALYFVIFGAILVVAMYLNVVWRPLGYATSDSRAKREEKEAKEAEREAAKEEAKAQRKAKRESTKRKPAENIEVTVPDKAGSGEKITGQAPDSIKPSSVPEPPIKVVTEKDIEKSEQVDKIDDADKVDAKMDEQGSKKD
ncbi:MAG: hypothetical protein Q6373_005555 [Candidatus Sigynarchaeota archaeon]